MPLSRAGFGATLLGILFGMLASTSSASATDMEHHRAHHEHGARHHHHGHAGTWFDQRHAGRVYHEIMSSKYGHRHHARGAKMHGRHHGKLDHAAMMKMHAKHHGKMDHAAMMKMHAMHHRAGGMHHAMNAAKPGRAKPMQMAMAQATGKGSGLCGPYMYRKGGACLDARMKK